LVREHVHQELNCEITAIGGHYVLLKEDRLPFCGREVLYLVGHAAFDTTCCGEGGCAYALVPGYVVRWKYRTNPQGLAVSQIEPIGDEAQRKEIRRLVERRETIHQVNF